MAPRSIAAGRPPAWVFKRIENLLRLGLDTSTTEAERRQALEEALSTITEARRIPDPAQWRRGVTMRFETCILCGDDIAPARHVFRRENQFTHEACWEKNDNTKERP